MPTSHDSNPGPDYVTVISPTLCGNAVFRTDTIVKLLLTRYRVQLVAFDASGCVYGPLADDQDLESGCRYHARNIWSWRRRVLKLLPSIRGRAIVCVKPMLQSLGAGLLLGGRLGLPVVLDIDDWERGFLFGSVFWEFRHYGTGWLLRPDSPLYVRLLEGAVSRCAAVTVSNSILQGMFGGHWLPHYRDAQCFSALPPTRATGEKIVLFAGAARAHKGLSNLLAAWKYMNRQDATLQLAIPDPGSGYLARVRPLESPNVRITGPHLFHEMPQILADASVVVVPQDNVPGGVAQLPMKLLDAMAAGRPIVATDVCDARRWLDDGAGIVVTPGSPHDLAAAISCLLDSPQRAAILGIRARERFLRLASREVLASRLCDIVAGAIAGRTVPVLPAFAGLTLDALVPEL